MSATTQTADRFALRFTPPQSAYDGWRGRLFDRKTGRFHKLRTAYVFEEFHGEQTWIETPVFDTKAQLEAKARKVAHQLLGRAA